MPPDNRVESEVVALTAEMRGLVERAEKGDLTALEPLRRLLSEMPALWRHYGDLAAWAERSWTDLISGNNLVLKESLRLKLADLRNDLGHAGASPLERLLIERATATWLSVSYGEVHLAQLRHRNAPATQLGVIERFLDRAHHRHLSSLKQLAQVRKLLTPAKSPIEIATRLGERRPVAPGPRHRQVAVDVSVAN